MTTALKRNVFLILILVCLGVNLFPDKYMQFLYEYFSVDQELCIKRKCIKYQYFGVISVRHGNHLRIQLLDGELFHNFSIYFNEEMSSKLIYKGVRTFGDNEFQAYSYPKYLSDDRDRVLFNAQDKYSVTISGIPVLDGEIYEFLSGLEIIK